MLVDFTGGLSSLSHAATHSMSSLHLNSVQLTDNGNYTCQPSGLQKVRPFFFLFPHFQKVGTRQFYHCVYRDGHFFVIILVLQWCQIIDIELPQSFENRYLPSTELIHETIQNERQEENCYLYWMIRVKTKYLFAVFCINRKDHMGATITFLPYLDKRS